MMIDPVVIYETDRVLIDRRSLATLTKRSVHTVRARCPIAERRNGRALYDMEHCAAILGKIATRRRRFDQAA
jgi:hypothetical protein